MQIEFSINQAAALVGVSPRTLRAAVQQGRMTADRIRGNGGEQYRIALDSLPPKAQAAYWAAQIKAPTLAEQRARLEKLNLEEQLARQVASEAGIRRRGERIEPLPLTPAEWKERREHWEKLPGSMRAESERRAAVLKRLAELLADGRSKMAAFEAVAAESKESTSTLRRWLAKVKNQHETDWYLMLAADYCLEGAPKAELHPDAWHYIQRNWLVQGGVTLTYVCQRAQHEAKLMGWGELPNVKTIKRRIEKEIDPQIVVLRRQGEEALWRMYPAQQRDYSDLDVHTQWVSDGRKADLWCVFPDGEVRRPIIMMWMDTRTRMPLGYAVGKTENIELVRSSLHQALSWSKVVPRFGLVDNGQAYASKEITGGQPSRNRGKVNPDDPDGILTRLGIKVGWATPGRGQSKPIESFWRTLSATEKRAEFAGAYCGNNPLNKPEEFDPKKAVPLGQYMAAVREDIDAYIERPHRGDSMDMQSPGVIYAQLMADAVVRHPTAEQVRMCLQAVEKKKLNAVDHSVSLMGNRYWCEALAKLPNRGPYTVYFDPDDADQPVSVYDGDRFMCEVPIVEKSGFLNRAEAKKHAQMRQDYVNGIKKAYCAMQQLSGAALRGRDARPMPLAAPGSEAPAAGAAVSQLVTTRRRAAPAVAGPTDDYAIAEGLANAIRAKRAHEDHQDEGLDWGRRAAGAR